MAGIVCAIPVPVLAPLVLVQGFHDGSAHLVQANPCGSVVSGIAGAAHDLATGNWQRCCSCNVCIGSETPF